ncbi:30035_t:CDS:2 [Gigaspora margarita]|uniref:30035_t:CDS:1 n=1 Tax=Gigaspora margarita TaxID=4874 RepID=A0ABN7VK68_GIGMA|nr:30035_t:CDS:2 [Gigaspora margarita]
MSKSITLQKWFEKTLKEEDIINYEYSAYENIEVIEKGGFGIVYSANYYGEKFALKRLKCDEANKEVSNEFIKELKQLHAINFHPNINQFYGITRGIVYASNGFAIITQAYAGYREQVIPGTPTDYAKLYRKCWNAAPKERPTILKILEVLNSISKRETLQFIKNSIKNLFLP